MKFSINKISLDLHNGEALKVSTAVGSGKRDFKMHSSHLRRQAGRRC